MSISDINLVPTCIGDTVDYNCHHPNLRQDNYVLMVKMFNDVTDIGASSHFEVLNWEENNCCIFSAQIENIAADEEKCLQDESKHETATVYHVILVSSLLIADKSSIDHLLRPSVELHKCASQITCCWSSSNEHHHGWRGTSRG